MKLLLLSLIFITSMVALAEPPQPQHSDTALETNGIKVEYYESSQTGIIKPLECHLCVLKTYKFDKNIKIYKKRVPIDLQDFMKDYWDSKYPTLFIDQKTNKVLKVKY